MSTTKERAYGETWIGKDGRVYVAVKVVGFLGTAIVPLMVATGAEQTHLLPETLEQVGRDVAITLKAKDGSDVLRQPELGPLLPQHVNAEGAGVLAMDILGKINSSINFKTGIEVRG
jgi:hypothetical protein